MAALVLRVQLAVARVVDEEVVLVGQALPEPVQGGEHLVAVGVQQERDAEAVVALEDAGDLARVVDRGAELAEMAVVVIADHQRVVGAEPHPGLGLGQADLGRLALLSLVGGTLGSAISCLLSACDRISHGWELREGDKYPHGGAKDKFVVAGERLQEPRPK